VNLIPWKQEREEIIDYISKSREVPQQADVDYSKIQAAKPPYLGIYHPDYERGWNDALEVAAEKIYYYLHAVEGSTLGADSEIMSLKTKLINT